MPLLSDELQRLRLELERTIVDEATAWVIEVKGVKPDTAKFRAFKDGVQQGAGKMFVKLAELNLLVSLPASEER